MLKKINLKGKTKLNGEIKISGAKNAALPILVSSLLCNGDLTLQNVPHVADTTTLLHLLGILGTKVTMDGNRSNKGEGKVLQLNSEKLISYFAPYSVVSQMRASFIVMGPLLARFGKAEVSLPGGCSLGPRAVDIHLEAFREMGVDIVMEDGYVKCMAKDGKLQGADIDFRFPSVGATQNVMMGACLAEGITRINNAAMEPEMIDLQNCLNAMGAKVSGAGTPNIEIIGVKELHSAEYTIMGDRLEAGGFMIGAIMTDGELTLSGLDFYNTLETFIEKLQLIGANIKKIDDRTIKIKRGKNKLKPLNIVTEPYPGYPTDIQAQMMALLCMIDGNSIIDETIFENRLMHVPELNRMGANITVMGNKAIIEGKENCFKSAQVMASDIRASMALLLAALCAEGETNISRIYHLERGYEFVADKLNNCGANIKVVYDLSQG